MGKINKDITVPMQEGFSVIRSSGLVYVTTKKVYLPEKGYNINRRMIVGKLDKAGQLHPNRNFADLYPSVFEAATGKKSLPGIKSVGLHAGVYAAADTSGLMKCLKPLGADCENGVLDYSTFAIKEQSDATEKYESSMEKSFLFSDRLQSDEWFSKFFSTMDTGAIVEFTNAWAQKCVDSGYDEVDIGIDGSNDNCSLSVSDLAEKGHAKSGLNISIFAYMYAVSVKDGTPVYWMAYRGSLVDCKVIGLFLSILLSFRFRVRRALLDRGFCTMDVENFLREKKIPFVLMMKDNTSGMRTMMERFSAALSEKWRPELHVKGTDLFGVTEKGKIFDKDKEDSWLHLYYDWRNGGERALTLLGETEAECQRIKERIDKERQNTGAKKEKNAPAITVAPKFSPYLKIVSDGNGLAADVTVDYGKLQSDMESKGFSGIATSEEMTAEKAHNRYKTRNNSEVCFRSVKSHLGFQVARVHGDDSVMSKMFVCFVASIIRNMIRLAAAKAGMQTNVAVRELWKLEARLAGGETYMYCHNETEKQKTVLTALGVTDDMIQAIIKGENDKISGYVKLPKKRKRGPKKGSHYVTRDENGNPVPRKPGPKPGSHHKKEPRLKKDGTPMAKPGPKTGSHHKSKEQREAEANKPYVPKLKKDGTPAKKRGPKPGSHHAARQLSPAATASGTGGVSKRTKN